MAVKIEKGGWIILFLVGLGLFAFGLKYMGWVDLSSLFSKSSSSSSSGSSAKVDTTQPLSAAATSSKESNDVRVRVNIWVGCVGGLVANGGLDTASGSIYADKGIKVNFKIIDDWTEGASALATN